MNVLITGGAGYIGSVLTRLMLDRGHKVKCLDRFFFGDESLKEISGNKNLEIIKDDIRRFDGKILDNIDTVIDMAALSNDPSGDLNPESTMNINYKGRARVAELAKKHAVKRYILASSCSIYGFREGILDEDTPANPLTTYAKANYMAEKDTLALSDNEFTVTVLRQATVYGLSPKMRFDLAINGMTLGFYKNKKIPIMRDGTQWRPFVHVKDTSKAFIQTMETEIELIQKEIFNIGSNEQNYQIFPLAELVAKSIGIPFNYEWYGSPDTRSYKINFDKAKNILKFKPDNTPKEGAKEIYNALENKEVTDSMKTSTVKWYKNLVDMDNFLKNIKIDGKVL